MPGGPKLPGAFAEVRTRGAVVLGAVAAVLFLPLGVAALVLAIRAYFQAQRGQVDEALRGVRRARTAGWVGVVTGVALWLGALLAFAR
jgi:Pyruvate/2-oxoacid:ferredoxin oxidoreductase gamma subunit